MSTHSIIAKPAGSEDEWVGVYTHFDGYPSGVGATLLSSYESAFGGDVDAMIAKLVDGEPVGWSVIAGADLSLDPHWTERTDSSKPYGPLSYAHRGETPDKWSKRRSGGETEEWTYVLRSDGLRIVHESTGVTTLVPWGLPETVIKDRMSSFEDQVERAATRR